MKQIPATDLEVGNRILIDGDARGFELVIEIRPTRSNISVTTAYNDYDVSPKSEVIIA